MIDAATRLEQMRPVLETVVLDLVDSVALARATPVERALIATLMLIHHDLKELRYTVEGIGQGERYDYHLRPLARD